MIRIKRNIVLASRVRYRIGGRARYFFEPQNPDDIEEAVYWAISRNVPFLFLGAGTNVLFPETGFDGLVMQYAATEIREVPGSIRFSAGTPMARAVDYFTERGMQGLAWAGGLPGTVGGAVFGNAGCFGGEIKDSVLEVESISFDRATGRIECRVRSATDCRFGYRESVFKQPDGEIVTAVLIRATPGNPAAIRAEVAGHIEHRRRFHPLDYPSAGSTFKNIPLASVSEEVRGDFAEVVKVDPFPIIPVAAVLDRLGLKGTRIGGAEISAKHPNFFINRGKATFTDISGLISLAKTMAWQRYRVVLEEEIRIVDGATLAIGGENLDKRRFVPGIS